MEVSCHTSDRFATIVGIIDRMPAFAAAAEFSYILPIDTVFSLTVQELFLLGQTGVANTVDQSIGNRFSLVKWIDLSAKFRVGELPQIGAAYRVLPFSVEFFSRR